MPHPATKRPGLLETGPEGRGEGASHTRGPDSAGSWSPFPVGNSELPPAAAAGGKAESPLSGLGVPSLCPLQPHPGPPPAGPAANCPPSSPVAPLATDKEGGKRKVELELTSQGQEKEEGLVRKSQEGGRGVGGGRPGEKGP